MKNILILILLLTLTTSCIPQINPNDDAVKIIIDCVNRLINEGLSIEGLLKCAKVEGFDLAEVRKALIVELNKYSEETINKIFDTLFPDWPLGTLSTEGKISISALQLARLVHNNVLR